MIFKKKNLNNKQNLLKKSNKSYIKISVVILIILFVSFYFLFKFQKVTTGPILNVETPKKWETFNENIIEVSGSVQNISKIKLNGRKIFVNQDKEFKEELLLYPGYNIIKIKVKDRFGKQKQKKIIIFHKE